MAQEPPKFSILGPIASHWLETYYAHIFRAHTYPEQAWGYIQAARIAYTQYLCAWALKI